ncbi:MAG: ExeM/NucH family extracellular endonuclease [Caldilineaceae bacterium]
MKPLLRMLYPCLLAVMLLWSGARGLAQSTTDLPSFIFIDHVAADPATGALQALYLSDGGSGDTPLDGLVVLLFSPTDNTVIAAQALDGLRTADIGLLTLREGDLFTAELAQPPTADRGVALYRGTPDDFTTGSALSTADLADQIIYRATNGNEIEIMASPALTTTARAAASVANGTVPPPATPTENGTVPPPTATPGECGAAAEPIHAVQGGGATSPELNKTVTIEGIVVGDFQDTRTQLRGFFVQEEAADQDADPATSEGIFVFDNGFGVDVAVGDQVRVRGQVYEYNTMTELKRVTTVTICAQDQPLEPALVTLPETFDGELEHYEGMLVHIDSPMTVAQNYFLGRYGQLTLAAAGRLYQPTNQYAPDSADAQQLIDENHRRILILDDGQDLRALGDNPNPVPYLGAPPPAVIRAGDAITGLVGVIDYGRINSAPGSDVGLDYRLQPTQAPLFTTGNPRTEAPTIPTSTLKVASFNVLNYFNGDGEGGDGQGTGFPTPRGATTAAEFARQRAKIIAAIHALNADIIGLMEVENDGYGPDSAIQDLVNGLNAAITATGSTTATYGFIDPGLTQLGGDEIAVGILYRTNTVTPTGAAATLATGAFDQTLTDEGRSRQPLAQTFTTAQGEKLTVVVNHFKSKRPSGTPGAEDSDTGNGAGAWNGRRTQAAQEIAAWLATDPTDSGDPDFLIIGDLNSYAQESPITTLQTAGYVNLIQHFNGAEAYSYVFDGQLGYLDHALASRSLVTQVVGATDWHINADEPKVLDYDEAFNPPGYYAPDPYRASDHDPVLIGLKLTTVITTTPDEEGSDQGSSGEEGSDQGAGEETGGDGSGDGVEGGTTDNGSTGNGDSGVTPSAPVSYVVQPGDTLSKVARRYSVTILELALANRIAVHGYIYPGQRLEIPPVADTVYCWRSILAAGESLAEIATRYSADPQRLGQLNGIANVDEALDGKPICIPDIYRNYPW